MIADLDGYGELGQKARDPQQATASMPKLPSRLRRLDEILADLPMDDPMLLSELDGYLTAVAVHPQAIDQAAWLPPIWGGGHGEAPPFDDPIDVQMFADMVAARHQEVVRDLARGKPQPLFDIDERNGEVLWEIWIDGFAMGMEAHAEGWDAVPGDGAAMAALSSLRTLVDVAGDAAELDSAEINALCDAAPGLIVADIRTLYAGQVRPDGGAAAVEVAKVGRNDPCPCGSGRKHKKCCAA
ncbi:UPF0149 family protein [Sphingomonas montana]|uniref:UPF0149 family protein n=1 Tax=Sphingomonas montana TaxID=1843236 RepID=UPI001F0AF683|nr:UPF0149 family protein [Sphingomonas montana]